MEAQTTITEVSAIHLRAPSIHQQETMKDQSTFNLGLSSSAETSFIDNQLDTTEALGIDL